ncbi:MAG TPA: PQQ-binding-like beta-propeller repeat protein, partial [Planctomycetia bacterium]|nr:PQQ-binding-like beta-propeller repeat protein [Planctomycetia bacterium]
PVLEIARTEPKADGAKIDFVPDDWPWWRGANGDNVRDEPGPFPTTWSATKNVIWKADVPGRGHASPVISGDLVFLASAEEPKETQLVVALGRADGKERWRTTLFEKKMMSVHGTNSYASPTPATDGKLLYALFQNGEAAHLVALARDGKEAWRTNLGPYYPDHGIAGSPVIHGEAVYVLADCGRGGFLAAVRRRDGEILWRTPRPGISGYGAPVTAKRGEKELVFCGGGGKVTGYDPETGKRVWECEAGAETVANSMVAAGGRLLISSGFPQKKVQGISLDPAATKPVEWSVEQGSQVAYVPSPVAVGEWLYVLNDDGILSCRSAATGKSRWTLRVSGSYSASPLVAGGRMYAANQAGVVSVVELGEKPKIMAKNDLGDGCFASPAAAGGRIYVRTEKSLFCIGEKRAD